LIVAPDAAGQRLDVFLAAAVAGVSRSQLSRHVAVGAVTVNGGASAPSRKLRAGDVVVWTPPPVAETELRAEEIPSRSSTRIAGSSSSTSRRASSSTPRPGTRTGRS